MHEYTVRTITGVEVNAMATDIEAAIKTVCVMLGCDKSSIVSVVKKEE